VVIDDQAKDILGITSALSQKGISSIPIHYVDANTAFERCKQSAVAKPRVIITDIQMREGGAAPKTADFANVAKCLAEIINNTHGPYVLLVWTSQPQAFSALEAYVKKYFGLKDIRLPLYFGSISKSACKQTGTDSYDPEKILSSLANHLKGQTQFRALLHWEKSVLNAAVDSVNTIVEVSDGKLEHTLYSLGEAVAGKNLKGHEASAINEAFSYILKDRISQGVISNGTKEIWAKAIKPTGSNISERSKHKLNALLHTDDVLNSTIICPGDVWLCSSTPSNVFKQISNSSEAKDQFNRFREQFLAWDEAGYKLEERIKKYRLPKSKASPETKLKLKAHLKAQYTDPKKALIKAMKLILVEISPACDFSNRKKPVNSLAIGMLIPKSLIVNGLTLKAADSIIQCPIIFDNEDYIIVLSAKYLTSLSPNKLLGANLRDGETNLNLRKVFRIRESLLQSWIHRITSYNSRIGTVSFH